MIPGGEARVEAMGVLRQRGWEASAKRWVALGNMPNNQSVVHAQQSSPAAALVEKFTNGLDAILLRRCKADGIDPRTFSAPPNMGRAVNKWFGDLSEKSREEIRAIAEDISSVTAINPMVRCLSGVFAPWAAGMTAITVPPIVQHRQPLAQGLRCSVGSVMALLISP